MQPPDELGEAICLEAGWTGYLQECREDGVLPQLDRKGWVWICRETSRLVARRMPKALALDLVLRAARDVGIWRTTRPLSEAYPS